MNRRKALTAETKASTLNNTQTCKSHRTVCQNVQVTRDHDRRGLRARRSSQLMCNTARHSHIPASSPLHPRLDVDDGIGGDGDDSGDEDEPGTCFHRR